MLSFKEWLVEEAKKPKKKKEDKDVKSTGQGSTEIGNVDNLKPSPDLSDLALKNPMRQHLTRTPPNQTNGIIPPTHFAPR